MQSCFIYTLIFLLSPVLMFSHGIDHTIISGGMGIEFKYSDNESMTFCKIEIYSPEKPDEIFQQGYTDSLGRFFFMPHIQGTWKAIISDGMGHGSHIEIEINKNLEILIQSTIHYPLWQKILSGIGIIGLLFTILYIIFLKRRKDAYS